LGEEVSDTTRRILVHGVPVFIVPCLDIGVIITSVIPRCIKGIICHLIAGAIECPIPILISLSWFSPSKLAFITQSIVQPFALLEKITTCGEPCE
jgi:hypothetical protein